MSEDQRASVPRRSCATAIATSAQAARKSRTTSTRGATRRCRACRARSVEEVRTYAKAQNFDLVIADEVVIYATPTLDITPAVLAALQAHGAALHQARGGARAGAGQAAQVSAAGHPLKAAAQVSQPWRSRSGNSRCASAVSCAAIRTRASSASRRSATPTPARSASSPIPRYRAQLAATRAPLPWCWMRAAADACPTAVLVAANPYATYARIADAAASAAAARPGRASRRAMVAQSARIDPSAQVGALAVIGERVVIGPRAFVGPALRPRCRRGARRGRAAGGARDARAAACRSARAPSCSRAR